MNQNKNKLRYIEKLKASEDIYIEKKKKKWEVYEKQLKNILNNRKKFLKEPMFAFNLKFLMKYKMT